MKIKETFLAFIIFLLIFGGIGLTMAIDLWSTTSSKVPVKYQEGDVAGEYNPADIRGSYTFEQVADTFGIDVMILYKAFGIPEDTDPKEIQTKDLEGLFQSSAIEIGNESMQVFVALYKNLPMELEAVGMPASAVAILKASNPDLTEEQLTYLELNTVEAVPQVITGDVAPVVSEEPAINGSTTFQKAMDLGITREEIQSVLGLPFEKTNQTIKDFCIEKGLTFGTIKAELIKLLE